MRIAQQPGYVLHSRPWRETSLMLECLTRDHGRVGLIARGARRERSRTPRAMLEPFQRLLFDYAGRGELFTLAAVEAAGPVQRQGPAARLAGLYVNELIVRLLARDDPHPGLLPLYETAMRGLGDGTRIAWTLRCFERDLLAELGYGLELGVDADSHEPLIAELEYVYIAEHGPVRWHGQSGVRLRGSDLLTLANGEMPDPAAATRLRRMLRGLLLLQLGGAGPRSARVLGAAMRMADTHDDKPETTRASCLQDQKP